MCSYVLFFRAFKFVCANVDFRIGFNLTAYFIVRRGIDIFPICIHIYTFYLHANTSLVGGPRLFFCLWTMFTYKNTSCKNAHGQLNYNYYIPQKPLFSRSFYTFQQHTYSRIFHKLPVCCQNSVNNFKLQHYDNENTLQMIKQSLHSFRR